MTAVHATPAGPLPAGTRPDLTITVAPEVVIFEGLANVHRYDQPSVYDIAAYTRSVLGEDTVGAQVVVRADAETVNEFQRIVAEDGIEVSTADPTHGEEWNLPAPPATTEWSAVPVERPVLTARERSSFAPAGVILVGVVVIVGLACGAAIWRVTAAAGEGPGDSHQSAESQTRASTGENPPPKISPEPTSPPSPPAVDTVVLEQDGLSVELPVGFHLEPDEDMWRATGPDPDFRLQLAVDPLYGVPPIALIDQIEGEIDQDPELRLLEREDLQVRYLHLLEDGSHALWTAWVDAGQQISVGCHTRTAPTPVQRTTCSMANDSARYRAPAEPAGEENS